MKRTPVQRTARWTARVARRVARRLTKLTGGLAMQWMQAMARHATLSAAGLAAALLLGAALAGGQAPPQAGTPAARQGAATGG